MGVGFTALSVAGNLGHLTTELERWREQGHPHTVWHHRASIFFWQWSHWFQLCCILLTTHPCPVNKQLSECSRVIGIRGSALYQSFFSTIQKYSRNRERERAKQLSFSVSVSLTHTHTLTHKHELENTDEQLSGQRIQFCDPTISSIFSAYTSKHKHSSRCTTQSLLTL